MKKLISGLIGTLLLAIVFTGCTSANLRPNEAGYHFRKELPKDFTELNYIYKDDVYFMKVMITENQFYEYIPEFKMTSFEANSLDVQELVDWGSIASIEWWNPESKIENSHIYYYVDYSPFPPYIHYAKYENGYMYLKAVMSVITISPN